MLNNTSSLRQQKPLKLIGRFTGFVAIAMIINGGLARKAAAQSRSLDTTVSAQAAQAFHDLFRSTLPIALRAPEAYSVIHMIPDAAVLSAANASSSAEAMEKIAESNLTSLVETTRSADRSGSMNPALNAELILERQPMTMVIVPGIFGEFIPTRGFEDIFSKDSQDRVDFQKKVAASNASANANSTDETFDISHLANKTVPLTDVVNVGSITDAKGKTLVRVVILYTGFMSLESLGDLGHYASIFNRRLAKYIAVTGPQKIALVGYSRGADLALEMLAQARAQKLPWLPQVKGMISLGGVNWGSSLADDTGNPDSAMHGVVEAIKTLRKDINPNSRVATGVAWLKFGATALTALPRLNKHALAPKSSDLRSPQVPTNLDPKSVLSLVKLAWGQLGLSHPSRDFADNVRRFSQLVDAILSGIQSLTSEARTEWWSKNTLPKSVTYYAITAAMANPEADALNKEIFDGKYGYSQHSYDDLMLLQNRLDYEAISHVSLNDSQVSVAQAMFLPKAIEALNSENKGLRTEMLGTVGTHHWGLALRVVNAMKDGRLNPFPREALLEALAAKVAIAK